MHRILALDYGEKRIGIALSDPLGILATGHSTYERKQLQDDLAYLTSIMEEQDVVTWVIGLPLNADGSEGEMVERAERFANVLSEHAGRPFEWADESYSSLEADEILKEKYKDWKRRKAERDMVAAQVILRHYLEFGPSPRRT
ncbi:MAG: putative Holliday junction resolvase [Planctomycetota bacterium]|jgi:putative Holliday junction resolvase